MALSDGDMLRKKKTASAIALFLALVPLSACTTTEVLTPVPQDQVGYAHHRSVQGNTVLGGRTG